MKRRNALVSNRTRAGRLRRERQKRWGLTDHGKYMRAKNNAVQRGVEWLFDESTWLKVWKASGHFSERGRGPGQYQMARIGDCGPYAPWNVVIVRMESNATAVMIYAGIILATANPAFRDEVRSIL